MEQLKSKPLVCAALVLCVLLVVGSLTFAGPCVHDDGSAAACHAAAHAVTAAGCVGAVAALMALFVRSRAASGVLSLVCAASGLFAAICPGTLFGLCMMQTMRCWTVMKPFALVCGVIVCALGVIAAIMLFKKQGRAAQ